MTARWSLGYLPGQHWASAVRPCVGARKRGQRREKRVRQLIKLDIEDHEKGDIVGCDDNPKWSDYRFERRKQLSIICESQSFQLSRCRWDNQSMRTTQKSLKVKSVWCERRRGIRCWISCCQTKTKIGCLRQIRCMREQRKEEQENKWRDEQKAKEKIMGNGWTRKEDNDWTVSSLNHGDD